MKRPRGSGAFVLMSLPGCLSLGEYRERLPEPA